MIFARDDAGNETKMTLPCVIKKKKFRIDKMNLSDDFMKQKAPEFQAIVPSLHGKTPLEVYIYVNSVLRNENFLTIQKICLKSAPKQLWEGTFLRMKDAATEGAFR